MKTIRLLAPGRKINGLEERLKAAGLVLSSAETLYTFRTDLSWRQARRALSAAGFDVERGAVFVDRKKPE